MRVVIVQAEVLQKRPARLRIHRAVAPRLLGKGKGDEETQENSSSETVTESEQADAHGQNVLKRRRIGNGFLSV